jgi:hypothetical protein
MGTLSWGIGRFLLTGKSLLPPALAYKRDVSGPSIDLGELLDLKMLPAWVHEPPQENRYLHIEGDEESPRRRHSFQRRGDERKRRTSRTRGSKMSRETTGANRMRPGRDQERHKHGRHKQHRHGPPPQKALEVAVRFLPHPHALENVVAQIKMNSVAYSLFDLARLFLAKPERYDVRLTASEASPLARLGEDGVVASDREILERSAFHLAQSDFYKVDITEAEPIKGNFTNVARCKLSGKLLGPTNHHDYQKRLRNLYEQRFSRRMSFVQYQRQVEVVADPQLVEKWKEDARKIATFSTLQEETPVTFSSATEAEKHFRAHYLPELMRSVPEVTIDGNASRRLPDRALHHSIENQWTSETRSPSHMMQELATQFRQAGLHVFRHRRGMLFVSPIRVRPLPQGTAASPSITRIVEALAGAPGTNRKALADKLMAGLAAEDSERAKLVLASDLRWLISEGYVVEFNDGSLDLPKVKTPNSLPAVATALQAGNQQGPGKFQSSKSEPETAAPEIESVIPSPADVPVAEQKPSTAALGMDVPVLAPPASSKLENS